MGIDVIKHTLAGQIVQQLNKNDNKNDEKIEASIWNKFVQELEIGSSIKESISLDDAVNSVTTYLVRLARQSNERVDELAKKWLNKLSIQEVTEDIEAPNENAVSPASTENVEETVTNNDPKPAVKPQPEEQATSTPPVKIDYKTGPTPEENPDYDKIARGQTELLREQTIKNLNGKSAHNIIDNKKQEYYIYKDNEGNKQRCTIDEQGNIHKLITISNPALGRKEFVTEDTLKNTIGISTLPVGVSCEYDNSGNLVFKGKNGEILNADDVKNYKPIEKVKTTKKKSNTQKVDKDYISTMQSGVTGLEYSIQEDKIKKNGSISLVGNTIEQLSRNSKNLFFEAFSNNHLATMRKIIGSNNKNENFNILQHKYTTFKQNLSLDLAIYQDLSKKSEITEAEKKFMDNFEQRLQRFINILNE